jgi:ketosteroid isomerase-like protein
MDTVESTAAIADKLAAALAAHDLGRFADLLDESVRWGGEVDSPETCHNRSQVLTHFERALSVGLDGEVCEVAVSGDHILLGLEVVWPQGVERPRQRYQVYTVRDGRIVDLRGFETREPAAAMAGIAS